MRSFEGLVREIDRPGPSGWRKACIILTYVKVMQAQVVRIDAKMFFGGDLTNGHVQTNEVFKGTRSSNRTKQTRNADRQWPTASVRKLNKPSFIEPFHVAVDRQLKSGYETYEAAEGTAIGIKRRYPKLYVTVFDAKNSGIRSLSSQGRPVPPTEIDFSEPAAWNAVGRHTRPRS